MEKNNSQPSSASEKKNKKKKWHNRGLSKMSFFVSLFKTTLALNVFFLSSLFVHLKNKKTTPPKKTKQKKTRKGLKTYKC